MTSLMLDTEIPVVDLTILDIICDHDLSKLRKRLVRAPQRNSMMSTIQCDVPAITMMEVHARIERIKHQQPSWIEGEWPVGVYWIDGMTPVWEFFMKDSTLFPAILQDMVQAHLELSEVKGRQGSNLIQTLLVSVEPRGWINDQLRALIELRVIADSGWWASSPPHRDHPKSPTLFSSASFSLRQVLAQEYTPAELCVFNANADGLELILKQCSDTVWAQHRETLEQAIAIHIKDEELLARFQSLMLDRECGYLSNAAGADAQESRPKLRL